MALQLVRLTKEVTFGIFPTGTPAAGTQVDLFLPAGNDFGVRVVPRFATIRDAAQGNRQVKKIPGRTMVGGALNTYLFPTQAPLMMGLAGGLVGTAPCYDLASFSCDHAIFTDNACAVFYKRYLGCKFAKATIACDDSDNGFLTSFRGDIIASTAVDTTVADFATPVLSAYPGEDPYEFFHTAENAGQLVIGGARSDYYNLSIDIANTLRGFGGEKRYSQRVAYEGRDVSFSVKLLLKSNADRALYEAGTKQTVSVKFDNGTNACLVDFGTVNNIDSVADDLPLGDKYTQTLGFTALVDPTITPATDMKLTFTP